MRKLLFLLLIPASLLGQDKYSALVSQYMQAEANVNHFSGAVLIMKQNKVLLRQAYGPADQESSVPNTTETKFRIGSITKQFTAACILHLIYQCRGIRHDEL